LFEDSAPCAIAWPSRAPTNIPNSNTADKENLKANDDLLGKEGRAHTATIWLDAKKDLRGRNRQQARSPLQSPSRTKLVQSTESIAWLS